MTVTFMIKGKAMKHTLLIGLLIAALLTACGAAPVPHATADSGATSAAATPTPQAAPTISQTETTTPSPTLTSTPTGTAKPTRTPKPTKTRRPKDVIGCFAPGGTSGPTAPFKLENHTPKKVTVYINGVSRNGNDTIYCTQVVKQGIPVFLTLMWGDYTYMVQVGSKITLRGSFFINDTDKATMQIFGDKIRIGTFP
jgi:septal ring-binding cell division protein DamX